MTEKCRQITGNFNHHADVVVRCGAHCWRKHIPVFTRVGNWMHTSGECLCHIVPTDAMVDNFGGKHKTQKKKLFFSSSQLTIDRLFSLAATPLPIASFVLKKFLLALAEPWAQILWCGQCVGRQLRQHIIISSKVAFSSRSLAAVGKSSDGENCVM